MSQNGAQASGKAVSCRFETRPELADRWGMSPKTLANWAAKGIGPKVIKIGKGRFAPVRYDASEADRWLESQNASVA